MRFYLIDRIYQFIPGEKIEGVKCITRSEDFLEQHFPGYPVMPGVLIIEAMAQLSGYMLSKSKEKEGDYLFALLSMIRNAKFHKLVTPGDQLRIQAHIMKDAADSALVKAEASVDGTKTTEAQLLFIYKPVKGDTLPEKKAFFESIINRMVIQENPFL
jgi:3-hydroxymyristoyl/3-hydroxydecanoyl-(acyl carrier protein) dehydratase